MARGVITSAHIFLGWLVCTGQAQTLVISNGVHVVPGLTNTAVVLTGKCELHITGTTNPIPGCVINLDSPDAYLVFRGVKPSGVVPTLLNQVRVAGAAAVADSNCRVVQYAMGAVVVPHAGTMRPLEVFSGPYFTGGATNLGYYTYYTGSGLGALNGNIRSFKLKRGYAVTFAEWEDGSGQSVNYVAQDGDLEIGILPARMSGRVRFVYVVPWRWASKKGIAGDPGIGQLNIQWWYNWNINQSSSRDLEYVPIKQNRWWPSLAQDWRSRGAVHLLGFNEPDKSDQANMTVAEAIAAWPELLSTGLRVGSPATTDGGRSAWLYPFITQADAAALRVDFVALHYYWCYNPADPQGAANQFYNFLKSTYDNVRRPLWVTEWNNGANWTSCADPTFEQQAACVAAMLEMLDNTPFVERYALYSWVEECRQVTTNGVLTPAGIVYRDKQSPVGHVQNLPDTGTRSFAQLKLDGDTLDSSGYGNNGVTTGCPAYTNGVRGLALVFDGQTTRVTLPPNVARADAFSFAAWVYWRGGAAWQRIFDFGSSTTHYMFLTPSTSGGKLQFGISTSGPSGKQFVETTGLPVGQWTHVAVTLSGTTARIYTNGALAATATGITLKPSDVRPLCNYLGKSQWPADPHFNGLLDEVLITDYALSAAQVAALLTNSPPQFTNGIFVFPLATEGEPYYGSLAGLVIDPDPGDTLTFSKPTGPAWLSVGSDGALSGTPTGLDGGTNWFTVRVVDAAGQNGYAVLAIPVRTFSASGVWTANADGVWSETNRWSNGVVATGPGQTADFSKVNITANRTVTLDLSRMIGTLRFGDTAAPFFNWTIASTNEASLTLDSTGATGPPAIHVTNTATIAVPLAGTNGFSKFGAGTLVLAATNTIRGTLDIDTGSTTANEGSVRLAAPGAAGAIAHIRLRNNNSGSSSLELDGSSGSIVVPAQLTISCRNVDVPAIRNVAGSNVIAGFVALEVGGNRIIYQSDSGTLVVAGTNQYIGTLTGSRTYIFTGTGNHIVTGPIRNSTNGAPIHLAKLGTGTLTLAAANTYGGTTAVSNGIMYVTGAITSTGAVTVAAGAVLAGTGSINGPVSVLAGGTLAPGVGIGGLTVSNSVTLQPGSVLHIELDAAARTNDSLRVAGALTLGGTLLVTNLGGTIRPGDTFTVFQASSTSGSFSTVLLPPLNFGLAWDTSRVTNGILSVVGTNPPTILSVQILASGAFKLSGQGSAMQPYQLLTTTNLAPPVVWTVLNTTIADTNGLFEFVDPDAGAFMQRFYRVRAE
ncbi:MAG: glycosyl hydrolase [Verrucomicrobiales bacterium]|nr:glycosyl hydrolase [Verrucomicrobiales bacterium]